MWTSRVIALFFALALLVNPSWGLVWPLAIPITNLRTYTPVLCPSLGLLLIAGGTNGTGYLNTLAYLNLSMTQPTSRVVPATLIMPRVIMTSSLVGNRYVLFAGGQNTTRPTTAVDIIDLVNITRPSARVNETVVSVLSGFGVPGTLSSRYATLSSPTLGYAASYTNGLPAALYQTVYNLDVLSFLSSSTRSQAAFSAAAASVNVTMSVARSEYSAVTVSPTPGQYYHVLIGGYHTVAGNGVPLTLIEVWDETKRAWFNSTAQLQVPRLSPVALTTGSYLIVIESVATETTPAIELFNMTTINNTLTLVAWRTVPTLLARRYNVAATVLGPYVYIGGGRDPITNAYVDNVEILDLRDGSLFTIVNMSLNGMTGPSLYAGSTSEAAFFYGIDTQLMYFTCGNGRVDVGEVCDVHLPNCAQNCSAWLPPVPSSAATLVTLSTMPSFVTSTPPLSASGSGSGSASGAASTSSTTTLSSLASPNTMTMSSSSPNSLYSPSTSASSSLTMTSTLAFTVAGPSTSPPTVSTPISSGHAKHTLMIGVNLMLAVYMTVL
jgi:hypothetical protein